MSVLMLNVWLAVSDLMAVCVKSWLSLAAGTSDWLPTVLTAAEDESFKGTLTPPPVMFPDVVVLPTRELLLELLCANASNVLFPDALDMVAVIIKAHKAKVAT